MKDIQKVYDFEVEEDHCYFANGILVSNSDAFRMFAIGAKSIGFTGSKDASSDYEAIAAYFRR